MGLWSYSYGYRSIEYFVDAVQAVRSGVPVAEACEVNGLATLEQTIGVTAVCEAGRYVRRRRGGEREWGWFKAV